MKFEEDLIINNEVIDENDEYSDEKEDEEFFDEYYYEQLLEGLAIDIKIEMQEYCKDMGLEICEFLNVSNLLKLIKNE